MITNGTINPAAKYKPVAYNSIAALTEAQRKARNCGLSMTLYSSLSALWTAGMALPANTLAWTYERPRGRTQNEWFRVLDFDGYAPGAIFQFQYQVLPNPCYRMRTPRITNENILQSARAIAKSDLAGDGSSAPHGVYLNLSSMNFGCAIGASGGRGPEWVKTFAATDVPFNISLPNPSTSKTYDVMFFFTDQTYDGETTDKSGNYVLSAYPHSSVEYINTLGLTYAGSELNQARTTLTFKIATETGVQNYQYIDVYSTYNNQTVQDTRVARSSGTLTTTPSTFTVNHSEGWPVGSLFFVRFHTSTTMYYEEQFWPIEYA